MEKQKATLILSLDLGASASKVAYSLHDESQEGGSYFMLMEPEVTKVPISFLEDRAIDKLDCDPESAAWISYTSKDREGIAVGLLAKKFQATKENHISRVKYEIASDKCLCFIGAIVEKHQLFESELEIMVNLLMPFDENQSKSIIENNLKKRIKNFYFRGQLVKGKLIQFNFFPEGTGGLLIRIDKNGKEWHKDKKIVVLMLGHRNTSCLLIDRGGFEGKTIRLGYYDYLKDIQDRSIGQNIDDLEKLIPKIEQQPKTAQALLSSLVKSVNISNQKCEIQKIIEAITLSRQRHWSRLSSWLDTQIPFTLDEIQIYGGASKNFKTELNQEFAWATVYWGDDIVKEISNLADLEISKEGLVYRYIDVYGLHKQYSTQKFVNKNEEQKSLHST